VAFYFALSDTIYCEDSDKGFQYAMKGEQRRRVISKKKNGFIIYQLNGTVQDCSTKSGGFGKTTKKNNNEEV